MYIIPITMCLLPITKNLSCQHPPTIQAPFSYDIVHPWTTCHGLGRNGNHRELCVFVTIYSQPVWSDLLSVATATGSPVCDTHNNQSSEAVAGPLHLFYCFNCTHLNVIAVNAIPTLFAVANCQNNLARAQQTSGPPSATSTGVNVTSAGLPATTVNISPAAPTNAPHNVPAVQNIQSMASPPIAGHSVQATVRLDGLWYAITKGCAVGVYRGWYVRHSIIMI